MSDDPVLERALAPLKIARQSGMKVASMAVRSAQVPAVIAPAGLAFLEGLRLPDADLTLLGPGSHRYFLFHSAIGLEVLRRFHQAHQRFLSEGHPLLAKITGGALSALAVGVGIHLAIDGTFQGHRAVMFPFLGSLVDGTLVDDNLWLIANSLWAFHLGHNVFVQTFSDDLPKASRWVERTFGWFKSEEGERCLLRALSD